MLAPAIYRSTDTNAPVLFGGGGSLITLLDAILVNGYGSAFASGVITSDGTIPSDGDTVTVGSVIYTFRPSAVMSTAPPYSVNLGLSPINSIANLKSAINGTGVVSADYTAGTIANPDVWTPSTASPLTITARK